MPPAHSARQFWDTYTKDLTADDFQRLFTPDAREAYDYFARGIDPRTFRGLPWHRRLFMQGRLFFIAFTSRLSPARRALFGIAMVCALVGMLELSEGLGMMRVPLIPFLLNIRIPGPIWTEGTFWLFSGFALVNLLVLLEVANRLTLKHDLEIAREIQLAMLPQDTFIGGNIEVAGRTRPANTVGGDLYDFRRQGGAVEKLATGGIALGMFDASTYEQAESHLAPGDLLVAYSDGITEAENQAGRPFDEDGLERAVHTYAASPAPELARTLFTMVE